MAILNVLRKTFRYLKKCFGFGKAELTEEQKEYYEIARDDSPTPMV